MGDGLEMVDQPDYFWFGTGFHYALEDFHGYNFYGSPVMAWHAYVIACRLAGKLPDNWKDLVPLGEAMMEYYVDWIENRDTMKTFWVDGVPQCEVRFDIPIDFDFSQPRYCDSHFTHVVYRGTIDRVLIDEDKRLWLLDYKTCKSFPQDDPDYNQQASAYCWAASVLYPGYIIAGFIFQHHRKERPEPPKLLASGKLSTNKQMLTTAKLYRGALINMYGSVTAAPQENRAFYENLLEDESEDRDRYIKREKTYRELHRTQAEGTKVMLEIEDMLDPHLPMYPNMTKDCAWDCGGKDACILLDNGGDWESELNYLTQNKVPEDSSWRSHLPLVAEMPQLHRLLKQ
jgi:hypothetical protein